VEMLGKYQKDAFKVDGIYGSDLYYYTKQGVLRRSNHLLPLDDMDCIENNVSNC
jgi:hypothetical protein